MLAARAVAAAMNWIFAAPALSFSRNYGAAPFLIPADRERERMRAPPLKVVSGGAATAGEKRRKQSECELGRLKWPVTPETKRVEIAGCIVVKCNLGLNCLQLSARSALEWRIHCYMRTAKVYNNILESSNAAPRICSGFYSDSYGIVFRGLTL